MVLFLWYHETFFSVMTERRNRRKVFSKNELTVLEGAFSMTNYPDNTGKTILAEGMGLPFKTIALWFQNKRAKVRKGRVSPTATSVPYFMMETKARDILAKFTSTLSPPSSSITPPQNFPVVFPYYLNTTSTSTIISSTTSSSTVSPPTPSTPGPTPTTSA